MNEETSDRFNQIDKRFEDYKTFFSLFLSVGTLIIGFVTIIFTLNFNNEKNDLREFKKELKEDINEELGRIGNPPQIKLFTKKTEPLEGAELNVALNEDKDGNFWFDGLHFIIKNIGGASSGPIFLKYYTSDPLNLLNFSTDEPNYKYEIYFTPGTHSIGELPGGGYSRNYIVTLGIINKSKIETGRYPMLIKIYYGNGKVERYRFNIHITKINFMKK